MTLTDSVRSALEMDHVQSHLHPEGSFDVADHPLPTGREEVWRFTPLKRLKDLQADAPFLPSAIRSEWNTPAGVRVEEVDGEEAGALRGISGLVPRDRFVARVLHEVAATLLVDVPNEAEVSEPVVVQLHGEDAAVTEAGHVALRFGHHSKATVVLNHTGSASLAQVVEIVVGDGADVTVVTVQDWADDAVHLGVTESVVGAQASLKHAALSFGGDLVRMDANATFSGPGGNVDLLGLYFADAGQHIEHRLFIDHNAPHTKSNAQYKGALQGEKAHTVWVGNVLIRKVAEAIDTYEENRNLVLTDGCQADSIPNLEIETGEIEGAGHASATGRFDDTQLFYLRSRGIEEQEARRLVVHGFFNDLIRKVNVPEIEEHLIRTVEAELDRNVVGKVF